MKIFPTVQGTQKLAFILFGVPSFMFTGCLCRVVILGHCDVKTDAVVHPLVAGCTVSLEVS